MARSAINAVKAAAPITERVDQTHAGSREFAACISDHLRIGIVDVHFPAKTPCRSFMQRFTPPQLITRETLSHFGRVADPCRG